MALGIHRTTVFLALMILGPSWEESATDTYTVTAPFIPPLLRPPPPLYIQTPGGFECNEPVDAPICLARNRVICGYHTYLEIFRLIIAKVYTPILPSAHLPLQFAPLHPDTTLELAILEAMEF